jgi:16S rRNA (uracil1498-N3)-methyltransferase
VWGENLWGATNLNIILFQPGEVEHPLSLRDERARHLLTILHLPVGGVFDAGIINGPKGKGTLIEIGSAALQFSFVWEKKVSSLCPIHLLVGLPRPQTARDILRDVTTLGVTSIDFVYTERGEPSYGSSSLWRTNEWEKCVIKGATQAFCTRLPAISQGRPLATVITTLPQNVFCLALDNYEASAPLSALDLTGFASVAVALGSERGWSPKERMILRDAGFILAHLGSRVLRTETACVVAIALLKAKLGLF